MVPFENDQTFETFVRGQENEAAFNMAVEFCNLQTTPEYPHIITGPSGDGKTHLLRAAKRHLQNKGQDRSKVVYLSPLEFERCNFTLPADGDCILLDDLSYFLHTDSRLPRPLFPQVEEAMASGKRFLIGCVTIPGDGVSEKAQSLWPRSRIVEILAPGQELRMQLAMRLGQRIPLSVLSQIVQRSRSLREIEGWIVRYGACKELGEPFNLDEGY